MIAHDDRPSLSRADAPSSSSSSSTDQVVEVELIVIVSVRLSDCMSFMKVISDFDFEVALSIGGNFRYSLNMNWTNLNVLASNSSISIASITSSFQSASQVNTEMTHSVANERDQH